MVERQKGLLALIERATGGLHIPPKFTMKVKASRPPRTRSKRNL